MSGCLDFQLSIPLIQCIVNYMLIKLNCFTKINERLTIENYTASMSSYDLLYNVYTQVATDASLLTISNHVALKADTTASTS